MTVRYAYWQVDDMWLGYLEEFPEYWTQGTSIEDLQEHLKDLQIGMAVSHERFGNGKVINMEGQFPNSKATVHFESAGQKQLLLKFAKLQIVG